jgi:hypothetical protein
VSCDSSNGLAAAINPAYPGNSGGAYHSAVDPYTLSGIIPKVSAGAALRCAVLCCAVLPRLHAPSRTAATSSHPSHLSPHKMALPGYCYHCQAIADVITAVSLHESRRARGGGVISTKPSAGERAPRLKGTSR